MKQILIDDEEVIKRFWGLVKIGDPQACWKWTGPKLCSSGYGRFRFDGGDYRAHRLAYMLSHEKERLTRKEFVIQTCGNRLCCNPKHLVIISAHSLQHALAAPKGPTGGFAQRGEKNHSARLTEEQVREIRRLYASKSYTYQQLADRYGVGRNTVAEIVRRIWWKWLDDG